MAAAIRNSPALGYHVRLVLHRIHPERPDQRQGEPLDALPRAGQPVRMINRNI